jgi:hypothetical protein
VEDGECSSCECFEKLWVEGNERADLWLRLHALPGQSEDLHLARRESDSFVTGHLVVFGVA